MDETTRTSADEVTLAQYQGACEGLAHCAGGLATCLPDEAVDHWLPELTRHTAIIFAFVGDNMTGRKVPRYHETVAAMQRAKDVTASRPTGTLPTTPQQEEE